MHIMPVEAEILLRHVVSVDIDDSNDEALWGVLSVVMDAGHVVGEGHVGHLLGVEYRCAIFTLTTD